MKTSPFLLLRSNIRHFFTLFSLLFLLNQTIVNIVIDLGTIHHVFAQTLHRDSK